MNTKRKVIAVDLDGTLAEYHGWKGIENIGKVVPLMQTRVLAWIEEGHTVVIFTARVSDPKDSGVCKGIIKDWLEDNGMPRLPITCIKRKEFTEFWDDRAKQVIPNSGVAIDEYIGDELMIEQTKWRH